MSTDDLPRRTRNLQLLLAVAASVAIFLPWSIDPTLLINGETRAMSGWEIGLGKLAVMLIVSSCFTSFIEAALKQRATFIHLSLFILSLVLTCVVIGSFRLALGVISSWGILIHFVFATAFYAVSVMRSQTTRKLEI